MIIYWDVVLIVNIMINFLFLVVIDVLHKERINYFLVILASLLGGGMIFGYLLHYQIYMMLKIIGGLVVAGVAYIKNHFSKLIIKISSFYIINYLFVGLLSSFKINNYLILLIVLVFIIILIMIESNKRYYYFLKEHEYLVILSFDKIILKLRGYLDTGNFAVSKDNEPIIFIHKEYYQPEILPSCEMILETLNHKQVINLYKPQQCLIYYNDQYIKKDVLCSFSNLHDKFECLLNVNLFI